MRDADAFHSCAFCRRQAARVDELEETIRQLRAELNARPYMAPIELGLSMCQNSMLGVMLRHDRVVSAETLFNATRSHMTRKTEMDPSLMRVNIHQLREKMRRFGLTIETTRGLGWRLTQETRSRLLNWNAERAEAA